MTTLLRSCVAAIALLVFGACAASPHQPAVAPTTIYAVRHAERDGPSRDPALADPAGTDRARLLARELSREPLAAVFASEYRRTRDTAAPTAAAHHLTVDSSFRAGDEAALARHILDRYAGRSVLVVGHSNTVPSLLRELGAPGDWSLSEKTYDRLFVVTVTPRGHASVEARRYGAPTP